MCLAFLFSESLRCFLTDEEAEALESGVTQATDRLVHPATSLTAITQLLLDEIDGAVLIRGDRQRGWFTCSLHYDGCFFRSIYVRVDPQPNLLFSLTGRAFFYYSI